MKTRDFSTANRAAWNEVAPLHRQQNMAGLLTAVRAPHFSCLDEIETTILQTLDVAGKDVAQLCCNNGRELLSVKNIGAAHCVGFDGAEGFIDQARELAAAGDIDCQFVCTDILEIGETYNAGFDLVTVTIGVLGWMPDIEQFFALAARLLRPGGALFIYEQHPIMDMVTPGSARDPIVWELSYFDRKPFVVTEGLDYYGGGTYDSQPLYSFLHKMSDVIMAGVNSGLEVEHFQERPGHISNTWYNAEGREPQLPMSYTLVLRKAD